jgi:nucleoside-diphosphate-sugar epimerase
VKALFIGGTGQISAACSQRAVDVGIELHVLNRGRSTLRTLPAAVEVIDADIRNPAAVRDALGSLDFDVVADFVAFTPEHVRTDLELFRDRVRQYVFISSASAYQTPPNRLPVTESTPLHNPIWPYSQAKIACEALLVEAYREDGFPATIVRPSHTYDRTHVPFDAGWTIVERMRAGKEVVVHGDGTSLWTLTHSDDFAKAFVGLLGHPSAIGDSFHITSDEWLTWNQITETLGAAAGAEPRIVHVPSDAIFAADETWGRSLLGDKANSFVFDNAKVKALVPEYAATIPFHRGSAEIVAWHDAAPARRQVDEHMDGLMDRLAEAFRPTRRP